jgi:hypothetical protein
MFSFLTSLHPLFVMLLFIASLMATLLIGRPMSKQIQKLKKMGFGIIDFELVHFKSPMVETVIGAWNKVIETDEEGREIKGVDIARANLKLDFWFIPAYVLLFASLTLLVSLYLTGQVQSIGLWLTFVPFVAGILDIVENIFLLKMLSAFEKNQKISPNTTLTASLSAMAKFGLLIIVVLYWLIGWLICYSL